MQAVFIHGYDIRMAFATSGIGILTGVFDQPFVGNDFVVGCGIAFMTIHARDLAMNGGWIEFAVYEYFFPWLQRSHLATSTFAFVFANDLLDRIGRIDEHVLIGVAVGAGVRSQFGNHDRGFRFRRGF
jgi:hypothetical protein